MVTNTGTYIDCPFHRYADGKDLSEVELERFTELPGVRVSFPHLETRTITPSHFNKVLVKNRAVLIHTGWDKYWNTNLYYDNHPFLTKEAAEFLRDEGALLVGIDSHNIDNTKGNSRPVHSVLLGAEILIVEHLTNLGELPEDDFLFSAIPPRFKGVGTFPVRAMAKLNKARYDKTPKKKSNLKSEGK
jgi:kynurenine formamidase